MKIYSMTATFGKLQHETLRFEDGLNIIEAPNEWGKSTWCAFITAMLYGIDTRQRAGGAVLADGAEFVLIVAVNGNQGAAFGDAVALQDLNSQKFKFFCNLGRKMGTTGDDQMERIREVLA